MIRIWTGLCIGLVACPLWAADPTPPAPTMDPAELVRQLGNDSYRIRERASDQLVQLGRVAKEALDVGMYDPDPEIASRCRQLLPLARKADLSARVEAFLKDTEGKETHNLPGWKRYQELVGSDASARTLFVEMVRNYSALLDIAEEEPKLLPEKYAQRFQEMQQQLYGPTAGARVPLSVADISTILFVGMYPELDGPLVNNSQAIVGNFFHQPVFRNALTDTKNPALRKLFVQWLDTRNEQNSFQIGMNISIQCDIKEVLPIAIKVVKKKDTPIHIRGIAMLVVGKMGNKEHFAVLEPSLTDEGQLGQFQFNNVMGVTQVRDVALAMSIHLSGQEPKDYGFDMLQAQPVNFNYYYNLGFSSDEKRASAMKKWKEYLAQQPKK